MGQPLLGVFKGFTVGGLLVWAFVDYLIVVLNCFMLFPTICVGGYEGKFERGTINVAFIVFLVFFLLYGVCVPICCCRLSTHRRTSARKFQIEAYQVQAPTF